MAIKRYRLYNNFYILFFYYLLTPPNSWAVFLLTETAAERATPVEIRKERVEDQTLTIIEEDEIVAKKEHLMLKKRTLTVEKVTKIAGGEIPIAVRETAIADGETAIVMEKLIDNYRISEDSQLQLDNEIARLKCKLTDLENKYIETIESFRKTANTLQSKSPLNKLASIDLVEKTKRKQLDRISNMIKELKSQCNLLQNFRNCSPALIKTAIHIIQFQHNKQPPQKTNNIKIIFIDNENLHTRRLSLPYPPADWNALQQAIVKYKCFPEYYQFFQDEVALTTCDKKGIQNEDEGIELSDMSDSEQDATIASGQNKLLKLRFSLQNSPWEERDSFPCLMFDEGDQPVPPLCLGSQNIHFYSDLPTSCQQVVVFLPHANEHSIPWEIKLPNTIPITQNTVDYYPESHSNTFNVCFLNNEDEAVINLSIAQEQETEDLTGKDTVETCQSLDSGIDVEELKRNIRQLSLEEPAKEGFSSEKPSRPSTKEAIIKAFETTYHPCWNDNPPTDAQSTVIILPDKRLVILKAIFIDYNRPHVTFPNPRQTVEAY